LERDYIYKLAEKGFKFFPCKRRKTKEEGDKAPATQRGFYDATSDRTALENYFEGNDCRIGFAGGKHNHNVVVIDVDINKDGDIRTVDDFLIELQLLGSIDLDGFQVETPSGGRHLYFRAPESFSGGTRFFGKNLSIDVRATGQYAIFPDNIDYVVYDSEIEIEDFYKHIPELPQWVVDFKEKKNELALSGQDNNLSEKVKMPKNAFLEIRSALNFIDSDNRDDWVKVGMALRSTNAAQAFGLWDEWSQKSEKYLPGEPGKIWRGFKPSNIEINTLFYIAKRNGWESPLETLQAPEVEIVGNVDTDIEIAISDNKPTFPQELLEIGGVIGDFMHHINQTAIVPQPIFSFAGALTAVGSLFGQKIASDKGRIRTNLYSLVVGDSGSGKDNARQAIRNCFFHSAVSAGDILQIENLASDAGLINSLIDFPNQLLLLDEIGSFLQSTSGRKANAHLAAIQTNLLTLYSSAGSQFKTKSYANTEASQVIYQPNVCLYGTTTSTTLYSGLTIENLTDGFLSRMIVFETDDHLPEPLSRKERKRRNNKPSPELLESLRRINEKPKNVKSVGNFANQTGNFSAPEPQLVMETGLAEEIFQDFEDEILGLRRKLKADGRPDSLYNRSAQIAEQVALIIAGSNNIDNPVITDKEARLGIALAKYSADLMIYIAENYLAENEQEKETKNILNMIKSAGKMTKTQLTRKTQKLKAFERNDIVDTLIESGQLKEVREVNSEKKKNKTFLMPI